VTDIHQGYPMDYLLLSGVFFFSFEADCLNRSDVSFLEEAFLSSYNLLLEALCDPLLQSVESFIVMIFDNDIFFCDGDVRRVLTDIDLGLFLESRNGVSGRYFLEIWKFLVVLVILMCRTDGMGVDLKVCSLICLVIIFLWVVWVLICCQFCCLMIFLHSLILRRVFVKTNILLPSLLNEAWYQCSGS